ncbi:hypothetical protein [Sphingomonas sp.]|uniref:hypothetical protein n=1 Tax=Sphingomonas sp. TaxID=28214 RepID=UPI003AFFA599
MIARAVLLLALLTAARDDPLAGRAAGPARECIDLDRVQGPEIVDRRTILYRENGRRIWQTGPVGTCGLMRTGDALIVELYGRQICRNDRFRVRSGGTILGATCRFTSFVPYDKTP